MASVQTVEPEPWKNSRAKAYLKLCLEGKDNYIQRLIVRDPTLSAKTCDEIRSSHELFRPYEKVNFRSNLRNLRKAIQKNVDAVSFDQTAFERDLEKYPKEPMLKKGYPRWNHSAKNAKQLLERDLMKGGVYESSGMKPRDLRASRAEYQAFPKKVFRDRIYRQQRKQIEEAFWIPKRNRKMKKISIDDELQSLVIRQQENLPLVRPDRQEVPTAQQGEQPLRSALRTKTGHANE